MSSQIYFQIIITLKDKPPLVYIINEDHLLFEQKRRMEDEVGGFPYWCSTEDGVCVIDTLGKKIDIYGTGCKPYTIRKTLWYKK